MTCKKRHVFPCEPINFHIFTGVLVSAVVENAAASFFPLHYDRLVEGFEKIAKGIERPWWKVFFGIW